MKNDCGPFDFVYIDESKGSADILEHSVLAWRLLKTGGVMIWDDYRWPGCLKHRDFCKPADYANPPRIAIDAFLQTHFERLEELSRGVQVIVRKK